MGLGLTLINFSGLLLWLRRIWSREWRCDSGKVLCSNAQILAWVKGQGKGGQHLSLSREEDLPPAEEACGRGQNVDLVFDIYGSLSLMTTGDKWLQNAVYTFKCYLCL